MLAASCRDPWDRSGSTWIFDGPRLFLFRKRPVCRLSAVFDGVLCHWKAVLGREGRSCSTRIVMLAEGKLLRIDILPTVGNVASCVGNRLALGNVGESSLSSADQS